MIINNFLTPITKGYSNMKQRTKDQILNYLHNCYSQNVNAVVTLSQIGAHLGIKGTIIKPILLDLKKDGFVGASRSEIGESGYQIISKGLDKNKSKLSKLKGNNESDQTNKK
jgi:DNA-binding MarR family transcriptional regulator